MIRLLTLAVYTREPLNSIGLEVLFRSSDDISLLPVVCSIPALLQQLGSAQPDVILLAVDTTVNWGLLTLVRREHPKAKIVLWLHDITAEVAFQAVECGVRGILRKDLPPEMIVKCVRKVSEGELWFEKTLTQRFLSGRPIRVSKREGELITLVSQGLKNKEIASLMDITEGTVKVYLSRLFEKIGARDRLELALIGLRNAQPGIDTEAPGASLIASVPDGDDAPQPQRIKAQQQSNRVFFARTVQ